MRTRLAHSTMGVFVGMFIVIWHDYLPPVLAWLFMLCALVMMLGISHLADREAADVDVEGDS